jgi:hypothetical protein
VFLIPYRSWHFGSSAAPTTLVACLRRATDFVGFVGDDSFRLVPASAGRNTYLPRLRGRLVPTGTGTNIEVTATLHPVAVVAVLALATLPQYLAVRRGGGINYGWLSVIVAFHVIMCAIGFWPKVREAEKQLSTLAREAEGIATSANAGDVPTSSPPNAK